MRILVLGMFGLAQGELSYEARAIHHIAELGHEVDYWTDAPLSYSMEPVLKPPQNLKNTVFHEGKASLAKTPRQFAPEDVGRIVKEHYRKPYDVIFGTAHTAIDMGTWLKRCLKIPLAIQILDVPYWRIDQFGLNEVYKRSVIPLPNLPSQIFDGYRGEWEYWFSHLEQIDAITVLISIVKDQIIQYSNKKLDNIHTVYHGSLDQPTFDHYLKKEQVERKHQVICINRIDFHKGVDQTVLVCKMIQDMMPNNPPKFIFVSRGNQPWYEDMIKDFAKTHLQNVEFTGWVDNPTKIRLIRESKVLLDNEWPEGFGGVCLAEAIYCGTQPLAWNRRSKLEVYPSLNTVELGNYQAMALKAVDLLNNFHETNQEDRDFVATYRSNKSHAIGIEEVLKKL